MNESIILQNEFFHILKSAGVSEELIWKSWEEIYIRYSESHRKYHTLIHLYYFLNRLKEFQNRISDWDTVLLALFYHDLIYDVKEKDNEEQSADISQTRLELFGYSKDRISLCKNLILATKTHESTQDETADIFTDCDLSILGAELKYYQKYSEQIREEYNIYPDELYKPGRKKVLEHFLSMDFIFKTKEYREKKEKQARENLSWELGTL